MQLAQDPVHVVLDGGNRDAETLRDLLVRKALVEQLGDLHFPSGQRRVGGWPSKLCGQGADPPQQACGDPRRAVDLSSRDVFDDGLEVIESSVSWDVTAG